MPTTAAISAGVGAAGSIGGALIGANASQNASSQQVAAQQQALAAQQALYNKGLGIATNALNPFINAGTSILPTLQSLITPGASQTNVLSQTPGFQFGSQYGTMAATNALAAKTGPSAGPLAAAISQFNNGLAQNTWGTTVNALQNYGNLGVTAAGALAGPALGTSVSEGGVQGGTLGNIGTAGAAGTLGSANALSTGLTGATSSASNALLYSQLFGNGGAKGLYGGAGNITGNSSAVGAGTDAQYNAWALQNGLTQADL